MPGPLKHGTPQDFDRQRDYRRSSLDLMHSADRKLMPRQEIPANNFSNFLQKLTAGDFRITITKLS